MAGKSSKVVIIDATTKTLAQAKSVVKSVPSPRKARVLKSAAPQKVVKSKAKTNKVNSERIELPSEPKKEVSKKNQTVPDTTPPAPRVKKSREFVVKLRRMTAPEISRARMRAVAYVGVTYVLVGVCAASYALSQLYHESALPVLGAHTPFVHQMANSLSSGTGSGDGTVVNDATTVTSSNSGSDSSHDIPTTTTAPLTTTEPVASGGGSDAVTTDTITGALATSSTTSSTTSNAGDLTPSVSLEFSKKSPFSERVYVLAKVRAAQSVEFSALPKNGLTPLYIGRATRTPGSDTEWRFAWETKNIPNGEYYFSAHITNKYGTYLSQKERVIIGNPLATATSPTARDLTAPSITEAVQTIESEMQSTLIEEPQEDEVDSGHAEKIGTSSVDAVEPEVTDLDEAEAEAVVDEVAIAAEAFRVRMDAFKQSLSLLIERFALAYRAGDTNALARINDEIAVLRTQTIGALKERHMVMDENYDRVGVELDALIKQETARIETRERMIVERVGEKVTQDTDNDGIVDYDELNLYKTDPRTADSDNDGFTDGAEIMGGFNPIDPQGEVMVAFESPEVVGPVRDDILAVASIDTEQSEEGKVVGARLAGKGLPNSFVSLYVFSTPVVVTVRTSEDGSWSYVFDKELEDGSHTVYAGITDNAGRIVAKSKPFPFVKTAEAFSSTAAPAPVQASVEVVPELISGSVFLLIVALSLVLLGLALVALGAYFMRPREHELGLQPA